MASSSQCWWKVEMKLLGEVISMLMILTIYFHQIGYTMAVVAEHLEAIRV